MDTEPATARPDGDGRAPAPVRAWRWLRARVTRADLLVVLVVAVVQVLIPVASSSHQTGRDPIDGAGVALLGTSALALLGRRHRPVGTFVAASGATLAYIALGYPWGPVWLAMIVALGTTVMAGHRRAAVAEAAAGYVTFLTVPWLVGAEQRPTLGFALGLAAWLLVLLTGAEAIRARRERAAEEARSAEEEARRRVGEERMRIARELHDVVAHNISLVNLQAGVALHLIDQKPEQVRTSLATIKDASREALVELRSVLGVLREVDDAGNEAPRAPAPGLARVDELVTQATATGVDVAVEVTGTPRPLAAGLDLAAFRIVQEALTNVARHAGPTTARVLLAHGPDDLVVEITDDGRRGDADQAAGAADAAALGSGNGITGMRERAEAVGGELEAGPRPGFGWRVRARLPLDASPDDDPDAGRSAGSAGGSAGSESGPAGSAAGRGTSGEVSPGTGGEGSPAGSSASAAGRGAAGEGSPARSSAAGSSASSQDELGSDVVAYQPDPTHVGRATAPGGEQGSTT